MPYNEKKFSKLSANNKLKKTLAAINSFLSSGKNKDYVHNLLAWLNVYEDFNIKIPETIRQWQILSQELMQILNINNDYVEEKPFDNFSKQRKVFPYMVVLDNIRSPFNSGSIIRSSECFGAQEIFFCGITPTPNTNKKVLKTTKNSKLPFSRFPHTIDCIKNLEKQNVNIYAVEKTRNSKSITLVEFKFPCALIFGNEEFGIDDEILPLCHEIIHIDIYGRKNSLNVSVTAGISLHYLTDYYINNEK